VFVAYLSPFTKWQRRLWFEEVGHGSIARPTPVINRFSIEKCVTAAWQAPEGSLQTTLDRGHLGSRCDKVLILSLGFSEVLTILALLGASAKLASNNGKTAQQCENRRRPASGSKIMNKLTVPLRSCS
jgi:hypothetical protein